MDGQAENESEVDAVKWCEKSILSLTLVLRRPQRLRRRIWCSERKAMHRLRCLPQSLPSARTCVCLQRLPAEALCEFQHFETDRMVYSPNICEVRAGLAACDLCCRRRARVLKVEYAIAM